MWASRAWIWMIVGSALLLSGCAGSQARQELSRLQSQVGLLDERVTQLERGSAGGGLSGAALNEPAPEGVLLGGVAAPASSSAVTVRRKGAASVSLKPTTREIQQALKNAGFYQGPVDGKWGPLTKDAIKEFQRVHGLTDDGVVGKQTWAKLKAYADLSGGNEEAGAAEVLK